MSRRTPLRTPLTTRLRSALYSSPHISTKTTSKIQSFSTFSPTRFSNPHSSFKKPQLHVYDFPQNLNSFRENFCSASSEKFDPRCWNCYAAPGTSPFLFCESCRTIQPVDSSVDYFQLFGLNRKYEIEDGNLEAKYKDWQKKLHPDLVHTKSEREKEYAAEQSARVTDAYRTIAKPLSRAMYILKLEGVDVNEEETISEAELLDEIMEIREAVEEATDSKALKQIQSQIQEKLRQWSNTFANAFQSQNYEEALASIRRMKYYERANEEIVKRL